MRVGDKMVCKSNIIYGREFPLVIDCEYILVRFYYTSSTSMTTYSVFDPLHNKVCDITIIGEDLIWDLFYSVADYRDIKLNQLL